MISQSAGKLPVCDCRYTLIVCLDTALETPGFVPQLQGAHAQLSHYLERYTSRLSPTNLLYLKQILFFIYAIIKILGGGL